MTHKEEPKPTFDLTVANWDYLAFVVFYLDLPTGGIDVLAMIYKDGSIKSKINIKFSSGNEMITELSNGYKTVQDTIDDILKRAEGFPGSKVSSCEIIYNVTTKGSDLFDLLMKNPNLAVIETKLSC